MSFSYEKVQQFLFREARFLDDKDWDSWLDLYLPEVEFWVPSWDDDGKLTTDPQKEISLMYYSKRDGLEDRVFRIRTGKAASCTPEHRTGHNITNIELLETDDQSCTVRFNWITNTLRYNKADQFFGTSTYRIVKDGGDFKIAQKKVILKSDYIRHVIDIFHI